MLHILEHQAALEGTPVVGAVAPLTLEGLARARSLAPAVVDGFEDEAAAPGLRRRLLEAGFTPGCPVRFVMATPFGDPLVFAVRGASIALRKSEARCVRVRLETP